MQLARIQDRPLPCATTDRLHALADLDLHGYCIVADVLRVCLENRLFGIPV